MVSYHLFQLRYIEVVAQYRRLDSSFGRWCLYDKIGEKSSREYDHQHWQSLPELSGSVFRG